MRIQEEIKAIVEVIKKTVDCEKIYLFGSYAYGVTHKDSDLDFYVVIPDDADRPIVVIQKIRANLGGIKRVTPIDILAARSNRFADMSVQPTLERRIARDGILLYERNEFSQRVA